MDQMPAEIVCKILGYLSTYDVVQFCKAYGDNCFLKEASVVRSVNFSQSFNTLGHDLYTSIASMNCDYIKQLNINYMYWISVDVLKNILSQLKNLEVLYAVGTELKMSSRDINQYVRLKKLAISLSEDDFDNRCVETIKNLTALRSLCLNIVLKQWYHLYELFLSRIPHLEELWICDEDITFQAIPYCAIAKSKNLKKLVIQSKVPIESDIDKHINQQNIKIFENKRNGGGVEMVFGVISRKTGDMTKSQHLESQLEEYFKVFETLRDMPYGPKDKKIIDITGSMETIYFEELNFCYPVILCKSKYMMAAINILSSRSARELKKLKVRSCLFGMPEELFPSQIPNPLQTEGKSPTKLNHPFWTLAQNLRVLKELEIEACPDCNGATVIAAYSAIQSFEHLTKLSLDVPSRMDGAFLKEVFTKCKQLESLYICCVMKNDIFLSNLCKYLEIATNIKHFRLENRTIILDKLLDKLKGLRKLQRIFLKCDELKYSISNLESIMYKFVEINPQLILLAFTSKKYLKLQECHAALEPFIKINPARILCHQIFPASPSFYMHRDILFNHSNIAGIDMDRFF